MPANRLSQIDATARQYRMIRLYKSGLNMRQIAAETGVTYQYVSIVLKEHGVELRNPKTERPPLDIGELLPLIAGFRLEGMSATKIAKALGVYWNNPGYAALIAACNALPLYGAGNKKCGTCGFIGPADHFDNKAENRKVTRCIPCRRAYQKARREGAKS